MTPRKDGTDATPPTLTLGMTANPAAPKCGETLDLYFTVDFPGAVAIAVSEIKMTLAKGRFPDGLAEKFDHLQITGAEGWTFEQADNVFTAKPKTPCDGQLGKDGLQFNILNIKVNNEPGVAQVKVTSTAALPGETPQEYKRTFPLDKVLPPLSLTDVYADPLPVPYGGSTTIYWTGSVGASITVDVNGTTYNHIKGHPGTPLHSSGNYSVDNMTKRAVITVTAKDGAPANATPELQKQFTVPIEAPSATMKLDLAETKTRHIWNATIDWTTTSATQATLTTHPGGTSQPVDVGQGSVETSVLVPTTFELTATNPVSETTATVSKTVAPDPFSWAPVGNAPIDSPWMCALYETAHGLGMLNQAEGYGSLCKLWVTKDAVHWHRIKTLPEINWVYAIYFAVNDGMTFISAPNAAGTDWTIYGSHDLETWSVLPKPPGSKIHPAAITFDDKGTAWIFNTAVADSENAMWTSTDQMQTLERVGSTNLPNCHSTSFHFMGGKLWAIGSLTYIYPELSVHSSEDGRTWTKHDIPDAVQGYSGLKATVFDDNICIFISPGKDMHTTPFTLWRIDRLGHWTRDEPTTDNDISTGLNSNLLSVAQYGGVLFTVDGRNLSLYSGGLWACNLPTSEKDDI